MSSHFRINHGNIFNQQLQAVQPAPVMSRELSMFPLPPLVRSKLAATGYVMVDDIINSKPSELGKELGIGVEAALDLLRLVCGDLTLDEKITAVPAQPQCATSSRRLCPAGSMLEESMTAWDLVQDMITRQQFVVTFSQKLDELLGGGVPLGRITEFCGAPGIGKTQVCLQLAVDVQIPECFGGNDGQAVFIDTEGSFLVERVVDIAQAAVEHCHYIESSQQCVALDDAANNFKLDRVLKGIHYFRCYDYCQLIAVVNTMAEFLREHTAVKLLIIDSIAFHFRHDFDDFSLRTRVLNGITQSLTKLAGLHKLAVVLTNQMTTKVGGTGGSRPSGESQLIPALGESWGHACTLRMILYWDKQQRWALLYKSPSRMEAIVPYQITTAGVRDVCSDKSPSATGHEKDSNDNDSVKEDIGNIPFNPVKRLRPNTKL